MVTEKLTDARVVDIGTIAFAKEGETLLIQGIGSCLAIFLYEDKKKISAVAHILLPESDAEKMEKYPGKYVKSAIEKMADEIVKSGGKRENIKAKIAGGAHMFRFDTAQEKLVIGERNIQAAIDVLKHLNIEIVSQDTGGTQGRTILVDTKTAVVHIKTIRGPSFAI